MSAGRTFLYEQINPTWWSSVFDDGYLDLYPTELDEGRSEAQVEFLLRILNVSPPLRILDVACGQGRHALAFAKRGFAVVGFDLSKRLLDVAAGLAHESGVPLNLCCGDMRELPFIGEFDLVLNLYTSFGYFADEKDHWRAFANLAKAVRPGGYLVMETLNRDGQFRNLASTSWNFSSTGALVLERHHFDPFHGRLLTWRTVIAADKGARTYSTSLRLFAPEELISMFLAQGLQEVTLSEGFLEEDTTWVTEVRPYTPDSLRICIIAHKPK